MAREIDKDRPITEMSEDDLLYLGAREGTPAGLSPDQQRALVDAGLQEQLDGSKPTPTSQRINTGDVNTRGLDADQARRAQEDRDKAMEAAQDEAKKEAARAKKEASVGSPEEEEGEAEGLVAPYTESKAELAQEARRRGLDDDGTKAELVDRLEADDENK
jgi:hypothetical protein